MVSEEEGSLDVSEDEVVDWRDSVVDKVKEGRLERTRNLGEDGKSDGCEGIEKWRFLRGFAGFFAFGEKGKSSE